MANDGRKLVEKIHREAAARVRLPGYEQRTLHYTELTDLPPDSPLYREWRAYRRELPRLLAEGQEGRFALLRGDELLGFFASLDEGVQLGRQRYSFEPFLVQPIREQQPLLRIRASGLPYRS